MTEMPSSHQDIRPLHIAVLNLMPTKEATETQLMRLIGNTPLYVKVTLLRTAAYESRHTSQEYLNTFYRTFEEIQNEHFDGLIITGAPVEHMDFRDVTYWRELERVMSWAKESVRSTLFICWAAQAALFYHYGINKQPLPEKMFGVFPHRLLDRSCPLARGFDDCFYIPVSRHTSIDEDAVYACDALKVVAASRESGVGLMVSRDNRFVFATGHSEYDAHTLANEYFRDVNKGLDIAVPKYYFPDNDPTLSPIVRWRAHANLLFQNWLNYYVYQETPYNINDIH
jgi:homoserine O-succinyltransferase